jgi:hypothetical protein
MRTKKKYLSMAAVLSATALTSVFASDGQSSHNVQGRKDRSKNTITRTELETKDHVQALAVSLASMLGVTKDIILEKINSGLSPREIIRELNLNELFIQKKIVENQIQDAKDHLANKLKNGEVSLDFASDILTRMKNNLTLQ